MNELKKTDLEQELKETKDLMIQSLPEKLATIEVTEDDLKKLRDANLHKTDIEFNEAVETFHIGKKLTAILQDRQIVMQIDAALEYLEQCKEYLSE